jgi:hypothetical protein
MTTDRKNIFRGHAVEISEELRKSTMGTHALLLYPDLLAERTVLILYEMCPIR